MRRHRDDRGVKSSRLDCASDAGILRDLHFSHCSFAGSNGFRQAKQLLLMGGIDQGHAHHILREPVSEEPNQHAPERLPNQDVWGRNVGRVE
jgi:hypothetical protein